MAEATIVRRVQNVDPCVEVVVLEASHGETFKSRFPSIAGVLVGVNEATGTPVQATFSSGTVTINGSGISDLTMTLAVYGHPK